MAGGGGTTQTVQKADPWAGQQPFLTDIFNQAQKQFQSAGPQYYPGQTIAPISPATIQAQQMATQAATGQQQQLANAGAWATNYGLTQAVDPASNPFFQSAVEGAIRPVVRQFTDAGGPLASIRSGATDAGQYGGSRQGIAEGIALTNLNQQLLDTTAQMGSAAYGQGLDAQGRALAFLPQTQQAAITPANTLDVVGQQQRQQQQDYINELIDRWNYEQNLPAAKLAQYQNMVQGNFGGTAQTTADIAKANPLLGAAGGAIMGYGAASMGMMGTAITPGVGTLIGAGLGLLLSEGF